MTSSNVLTVVNVYFFILLNIVALSTIFVNKYQDETKSIYYFIILLYGIYVLCSVVKRLVMDFQFLKSTIDYFLQYLFLLTYSLLWVILGLNF